MASSSTIAVAPAQAARTRLLLEGPIASTLLRLAVPNLVVNVVLIAVVTASMRVSSADWAPMHWPAWLWFSR